MQLLNYNGVYLITRICFDEISSKENISEGRNVLCINETTAVLYCNGTQQTYTLSGEICFNENDSITINEKGFCQILFPFDAYNQTIVVTNKCNSNCVMCPYTSSFRKNTPDTETSFLLDAVQYLPQHTVHLVVTGGEPTLKTDGFFALMEKIKNNFPHTNCLLLSNGRSFSIASICKSAERSFPKKTLVAIPLHAATAEIHDKITQTDGSFKQTIIGTKNLLRMGIDVEIRVLVWKYNYKDIHEISKLIIDSFRQVKVVNFMATEMCGNPSINPDEIWIDYKLAFKACEEPINELIANGIDVGIYNFPLCSVPKRYWALYKRSISEYKIRFGKVCDGCEQKSVCGGVFASSLKYAEPNMTALGD